MAYTGSVHMTRTEQGPGVAAFIGARVYVNEGEYSTDSSLVYELVELARQADEFFLHCFLIDGRRARDVLRPPPSLRLVQLGAVRNGRDLYGHPLLLWRRIAASVRGEAWSRAVLVEPGLPSLLALIACWLARRPSIALIRGDPAVGGVAHRHRHGPGRFVGGILRRFRVFVCRALARTVPVVTDSDVVARRLAGRGAAVHRVPAASISQEDVLPPGPPWQGTGRLRVLFVGRLEPVKHVEMLLAGLRQATGRGGRYLLQIVGAGDPAYTAMLRARIRSLGLSDSVEFVGQIPHGPRLYRYYQQAHVLVLSSRSEGIPKVAVEAMAHRLPVIATRVGGLPGIVTPGAGILVPPADEAALGSALSAVHDSPALAASMSEGAAQVAAGMLAGPVSRRLASVVAASARPPGLRSRRGIPGPAMPPSHDAIPDDAILPPEAQTSMVARDITGKSDAQESPGGERSPASLRTVIRALLPASLGNLTAQGALVLLGFLTGIATARTLGPSLRGELSFLVLVPGIMTVMGTLGAEYGIYYYWHQEQGKLRAPLLGASLAVTVLAGSLSGAVGFAAVSWFEPRAGVLLPILTAVSIPLSIANAILTMALMAQRRIAAYNTSRLVGPVIYALAVGALWAAGELRVASAFAAWLAGVILTVIADVALLVRSQPVRPLWDLRTIRRTLAYGFRSYPGAVAQHGTLRLDQFMLVALAGNAALGAYYAAVTVGEAVLQISDNIANAMMALMGGQPHQEQRHLAVVSVAMAGLVASAVAALLMVYGGWVIALLLGKAYIPGLAALRILLPGSVLLAMARVMNGYFVAAGEAQVFARAALLSLVITIVGNAALIPSFQAVGAALASTISYAVLAGWLGLKFRTVNHAVASSGSILAGGRNDALAG